jgi:D-3-phosphoglycerate dehydrogenase / 2-oxoglutarate reductase
LTVRISYIDCGASMRELLADCGPLADGIDIFDGDPAPDKLAALVRDAHVVLDGHTVLDGALLAQAPRLRSIVFLGTGASNYIDLAAASGRGIVVRAVKNYGDRTIAEHAFGLLLVAARGFVRMDRDVRSGIWAPQNGIELAGKTLGIIGVGATGAEMARIAFGFGMRVIGWNRSGVAADVPCTAMPLDDVLVNADAISVHLALCAETHGFFDARRLNRLKPGCLLVNVARGSLFDESALMEALRAGRIAHAALDVFTTEPLPQGHALTMLPNVTLSAHAAWKSREASLRLLRRSLELAHADAERLVAGNILAP